MSDYSVRIYRYGTYSTTGSGEEVESFPISRIQTTSGGMFETIYNVYVSGDRRDFVNNLQETDWFDAVIVLLDDNGNTYGRKINKEDVTYDPGQNETKIPCPDSTLDVGWTNDGDFPANKNLVSVLGDYNTRSGDIDVGRGPIPGSVLKSGQDFETINFGGYEESVEYEESRFKLDNISLTVDTVPEWYWKEGDQNPLKSSYAPYVCEVREGSQADWNTSEVLFHGVIDGESVQYVADTTLTNFKVWSWDYLLTQVGELPARSIYETESFKGLDVSDVERGDVGIPIPSSIVTFQGVSVGDVVELDSDSGAIRSAIESIQSTDEIGVKKLITSIPAKQNISFDSASLSRPTIVGFGNPNRVAASVGLLGAGDLSRFETEGLEVTVTFGTKDFTRGVEEIRTFTDVDGNLVNRLKFDNTILPDVDIDQWDEIRVTKKNVIEEGDDIKIYGRDAYGYYPGVGRDFKVIDTDGSGNPTGLIPAILSLGDTPRMNLLSHLIDTFTFGGDTDYVDHRMTFPKKPQEALSAIQHTAGVFVKMVPKADASDPSKPKIEVRVIDKKSLESGAIQSPFDVKTWSEKTVPSPIKAVVVETEDYPTPDEYGDICGFYPAPSPDSYTDKPEGDGVVEISTVQLPSLEGPIYSGSDSRLVNDSNLYAIAKARFAYYDKLSGRGKATLYGAHTDIVGRQFTFNDVYYEEKGGTLTGRTVFVTKASVNLEEGETEIEFRRGEYTAPTESFVRINVDAPDRLVAEGGTAPLVLDASQSIAPAGTDYEWSISGAATGTQNSQIARFTGVPTGSISWTLTLTLPDGTTLSESGSVSVVQGDRRRGDTRAEVEHEALERSNKGVVKVLVSNDGEQPSSVQFQKVAGGNVKDTTNAVSADTVNSVSNGTEYVGEVDLVERHASQIRAIVQFDGFSPVVIGPLTFDQNDVPSPAYNWTWEYNTTTQKFDLYVSVNGDVDTRSVECVTTYADNSTNRSFHNGRNIRFKANTAKGITPETNVELNLIAYSGTNATGTPQSESQNPAITAPVAPDSIDSVVTDNRYVQESGDTMDGDLSFDDGSGTGGRISGKENGVEVKEQNTGNYGSLTVSELIVSDGTKATQIESEVVEVADSLFALNSDYTGSSPSAWGGLYVVRGTKTDKGLVWNESADRWGIADVSNDSVTTSTFQPLAIEGGGATFEDVSARDITARSLEFDNTEMADSYVGSTGGQIGYDASTGFFVNYGTDGSGVTKGLATLLDTSNTATGANISLTGGTADRDVPTLSIVQGNGSDLDADKLDGYHAVDFPRKAENATITGKWNWGDELFAGSSASIQVNGFLRTGPIYIHDLSAADVKNTNSEISNVGGTLKWANNKIWHAENDGSGSGLDADKLDGYQGSAFPRKAEQATITNSWSFDKNVGVYGLDFNNTDNNNHSASDGTLYYDRNHPYGLDNSRGGLVLYNSEDGWGGIIDTNNSVAWDASIKSVASPDYAKRSTGWGIDVDDGNRAEFGSLYVRGAMYAREFNVEKIRYRKGQQIVGAGGGRVKEVSGLGSDDYEIIFEDVHGLSVGDVLIAQEVDTGAIGSSRNDEGEVTQYVHQSVVRVENVVDNHTVHVDVWKYTDGSSNSDVPQVGWDFVQVGSNDSTRDSFLSLDPYIPAFDVYDGMYGNSQKPDFGNKGPKVRLGYLNTINHSDLSPSGYGLFAENAYLKGEIVADSGTIADSVVIGGRSASTINSQIEASTENLMPYGGRKLTTSTSSNAWNNSTALPKTPLEDLGLQPGDTISVSVYRKGGLKTTIAIQWTYNDGTADFKYGPGTLRIVSKDGGWERFIRENITIPSNATHIRIGWNDPNSGSGTSYAKWGKLNKGPVATAYQRPTWKREWGVDGKTTIDGGNIEADTITATEANFNDLNAVAASIAGFSISSNRISKDYGDGLLQAGVLGWASTTGFGFNGGFGEIQIGERDGNPNFLAYKDNNNAVEIGAGWRRDEMGITVDSNGRTILDTKTSDNSSWDYKSAYLDNLYVAGNVTIDNNVQVHGGISVGEFGLNQLVWGYDKNESGNMSWPFDTDINNANEFTFKSPVSGRALIRVYARDAEGGAHIGLNDKDLGSMQRNGPNGSTEWYTFYTDNLVRGQNVFQTWSTTGDGGHIEFVEVYGASRFGEGNHGQGDLRGVITAPKIAAGSITADKIDVNDLDALNATIGNWDINSDSISGTSDNGLEMALLLNGDSGVGWNTNTRGFTVGKDGNNRIWLGDNGLGKYELALYENGNYIVRLGEEESIISGWTVEENRISTKVNSVEVNAGDISWSNGKTGFGVNASGVQARLVQRDSGVELLAYKNGGDFVAIGNTAHSRSKMGITVCAGGNNVLYTDPSKAYIDNLEIRGNATINGDVRIGSSENFRYNYNNISSNGWYRIAYNPGNRASARFRIWDTEGGRHNFAEFSLSAQYNNSNKATLQLHRASRYDTHVIKKVRLLTNGTYDQMYVEVYLKNTDGDYDLNVQISDNEHNSGWKPQTQSGSIPSGYSSREWKINSNQVADEALANWSYGSGGDFTEIDGGNIATDTIDARVINVSSLSAVNTSTGNLDVSGTLTMGTNGEITNSNNDFLIDETGLELSYGNNAGNKIDFKDQYDYTAGSLYYYTGISGSSTEAILLKSNTPVSLNLYSEAKLDIESLGGLSIESSARIKINSGFNEKVLIDGDPIKLRANNYVQVDAGNYFEIDVSGEVARFVDIEYGVGLLFQDITYKMPSKYELEQVMGPNEAMIFPIRYGDGNINLGWAETDGSGNVQNRRTNF
ncbi:hypothetical protein [Salinibacter phage M8CC-19]|uniref:Uncharacterized protein n=1 Tax=Salinibacter phage M8CC-19 TaxID=2681613 RepID=A0A2I6UG44_9CAUD|nr:tail protein [Salinibacter phage M8CC-19]AUO78954.1 hypothetical protein [Salinibacter phage M8CC-19]